MKLSEEERIEHLRQYQAEYYRRNREKICARKKARRIANSPPKHIPTPEEIEFKNQLKRQKNREYYKTHKEKFKEISHKYYMEHKHDKHFKENRRKNLYNYLIRKGKIKNVK